MTFTIALMIAVSYWGARDVPTPCHPVGTRISFDAMAVYNAQDGVTADMRADSANCRILIGPNGAALRTLDEPVGFSYCAEIVHEVGHIDGLSHAYGGVMAPDGSGHVPWGCTHRRAWLRAHVSGRVPARTG